MPTASPMISTMVPANLLLLLVTASSLIPGKSADYPITADLSTTWINNGHYITYNDGPSVLAVIVRSPLLGGPSFAAGFYCAFSSAQDISKSCLFAVFIVYTGGSGITLVMNGVAQVVWSANRARPVRENAVLELTFDGNLVLRDADGSLVWSSGTAGKSVAGLTITELGNLVLFDQKNRTVWQSFDHPTDVLVPGQSLVEGMRLTANTSAANWTQNQLYMTVLPDGLYAYAESVPPQLYFSRLVNKNKTTNDVTKVTFTNGSLGIFSQPGHPDEVIELPATNSTQYLRFESDGHLRLYEWSQQKWNLASDVIKIDRDECAFPTVCGEYGICTRGQCICPFQTDSSRRYFMAVDGKQSNLGCEPLIPISCSEAQDHELLTLTDVSYFDISHAVVSANSSDDCKEACLNDCSCRAVMFLYFENDSVGRCSWVTKVYSLKSIQPKTVGYNSSAYLKVQLNPSKSTTNNKKVILGPTFAGIATLVLTGIAIAVYLQRSKKTQEIDEEIDFEELPGMPIRFPYEKLRECTANFSKKLGEGGFGSVFEGKLDEERVAVKQLESAMQGKKEFLAEVETIGSIEHINLVRLVGFCAEKTHRLLVYEYMPRGSLDSWIYNNISAPLDWTTRCRIILDIAKGLCYLHEECRRKIAHLDIKPQNILLDEKFNAKLADFGLSKLIDRDQSRVMTVMRGTPGYLAPEWLITSEITEKVDIYSFGVVIMEVVCGRKCIDTSQPQERIQLIKLLREKVQNNQLIDMIDNKSKDMVSNQEEVIKMMRLAVWCLQSDSNRRPSMSKVVKVLDGTTEVESCLDDSFFNANPVTPLRYNESTYSIMQEDYGCFEVNPVMEVQDGIYSAPPSASILSGPR